jgi:DNA (cytosine-5)-methyltransferase 1
MSEIQAVPRNGFKVASTFSGCGGSCLGYRMAGFKVVYASEFVEAARQSYRSNHPDSFLDDRDIRQVTGAEIMAAAGVGLGELDVLDGSPPCASFSTCGKRDKGWGDVKTYSDTKQRTDDLFFEYARLVAEIRPKTFVAENVSGLIKGTAKGYFLRILAALKAVGYRVEARLLDASWLGVPQMRQRLIFVGVREDLGLSPTFPRPLPYQYTFADAFGPSLELGPIEPETDFSQYACAKLYDDIPIGTHHATAFNAGRHPIDRPAFTLTTFMGNNSAHNCWHPTRRRLLSVAEGKRLSGFPDDFQLIGTYRQQWERIGRAVPPLLMASVAATIRDQILCRLPTH